MKKIVQQTHPALRQLAEPVAPPFRSVELDRILKTMSEALAAEEDGVALAAPQIGIAKQIFIVSPRALPRAKEDLVFINPRILKHSKRSRPMLEGCLSIRHYYGDVKRWEKVTVEALDREGKRFTRHTSGLLAQIVQHETDHLGGVLFIDKAKNVKKIDPETFQEIYDG